MAAAIASLVLLLTLLAPRRMQAFATRAEGLFAGLLLTISVLHILPEAFSLSSQALGYVLAGTALGLLLFRTEKGEAGKGGADLKSIAALAALGLHSTLDGVIYSVAFAAGSSSGLYTVLSLILHEIPEGLIAFTLFTRRGAPPRVAALFAFILAALTTPLGALLGSRILVDAQSNWLAAAYAFSAGLLTMVATAPLVALIGKPGSVRAVPAILAGCVIGVALHLLPLGPHRHDMTPATAVNPP
jgi:ZIP family zinc transporter